MSLNKHPAAKTFIFPHPFYFETTWMGNPEQISQLEVAYEIWGDPSHPTILICHPLSVNTHCTDTHCTDTHCTDTHCTDTHFANTHCTDKPDGTGPSNSGRNRAWWSAMVGPNKPIDTNRFQVICTNMIGGCGGSSGPASMNPKTKMPYRLHFPVVTIGDIVRSQHLLLQSLGIERLHAVVGGSMGGFQALEWAISYPLMVDNIIVIASGPYSTQFQIMTNRVQIESIQRDGLYQQGHYRAGNEPNSGLIVARKIGHTTFIAPQAMEQKFVKYYQSMQKPVEDTDFHSLRLHEAESYLRHVSTAFSQYFDANSMIYMLQTWSHFDLKAKYGPLAGALSSSKARILSICANRDNLFPPFLSRVIQREALKAGLKSQLIVLREPYGHDFFLLPEIITSKLAPIIEPFLA